MRYIKPQIQEDQKAPSRIITNKSTDGHIIFKLRKPKTEKIFKEARVGGKKIPSLWRNEDKC